MFYKSSERFIKASNLPDAVFHIISEQYSEHRETVTVFFYLSGRGAPYPQTTFPYIEQSVSILNFAAF